MAAMPPYLKMFPFVKRINIPNFILLIVSAPFSFWLSFILQKSTTNLKQTINDNNAYEAEILTVFVFIFSKVQGFQSWQKQIEASIQSAAKAGETGGQSITSDTETSLPDGSTAAKSATSVTLQKEVAVGNDPNGPGKGDDVKLSSAKELELEATCAQLQQQVYKTEISKLGQSHNYSNSDYDDYGGDDKNNIVNNNNNNDNNNDNNNEDSNNNNNNNNNNDDNNDNNDNNSNNNDDYDNDNNNNNNDSNNYNNNNSNDDNIVNNNYDNNNNNNNNNKKKR